MGTRNLTSVIYQEKTRVAQYGQWDGYPEGQGKTVLEFLKTFNPDKFKEQLLKIRWITSEEADKINKDKDWTTKYPHLSRDRGANILNLIHSESTKIDFLVDSSEFIKDGLFCEWAYIIDLDKNTLDVYSGSTKPIKTYLISDLPTFEQFVKDLEPQEETEDEA